MIEAQTQREYVRTDSWSVSAKVCKATDPDEWYDVQVPNIAAGGALLSTKAVLAIGDEVQLDMEIDPMTPGITRKVPMKAKGIIRSDRGSNEVTYTYSVEFTEISKNDKTRLDEMIRMSNYSLKLGSEADEFSVFNR